MRTITKLQTLLVLFLTTAMIGFVGCKDDDGMCLGLLRAMKPLMRSVVK